MTPSVPLPEALYENLRRSGVQGGFVLLDQCPFITWPQLGPFFVPACPPLTAINGYQRPLTAIE